MYCIAICLDKINDKVREEYKFYDCIDQRLYDKIRKELKTTIYFSDDTIDALNLALRGMWKDKKPIKKPKIYSPFRPGNGKNTSTYIYDNLYSDIGSFAKKGNI